MSFAFSDRHCHHFTQDDTDFCFYLETDVEDFTKRVSVVKRLCLHHGCSISTVFSFLKSSVFPALTIFDCSGVGKQQISTLDIGFLLKGHSIKELRADCNSFGEGVNDILEALLQPKSMSFLSLAKLSLRSTSMQDEKSWENACKLLKKSRSLINVDLSNNRADCVKVLEDISEIVRSRDCLLALDITNCFENYTCFFEAQEDNLSLLQVSPPTKTYEAFSPSCLETLEEGSVIFSTSKHFSALVIGKDRLIPPFAAIPNFTSKDIRLRNEWFAWTVLQHSLFSFVVSLFAVELPIYVLLDIFDWTLFCNQMQRFLKTNYHEVYSLAKFESISKCHREKKVHLIQKLLNRLKRKEESLFRGE